MSFKVRSQTYVKVLYIVIGIILLICIFSYFGEVSYCSFGMALLIGAVYAFVFYTMYRYAFKNVIDVDENSMTVYGKTYYFSEIDSIEHVPLGKGSVYIRSRGQIIVMTDHTYENFGLLCAVAQKNGVEIDSFLKKKFDLR